MLSAQRVSPVEDEDEHSVHEHALWCGTSTLTVDPSAHENGTAVVVQSP